MTLRFRRSIRLGKFFRLNVGKTGPSLSAGVRGLHAGIGRRGPYMSAGLPGSGLSAQVHAGRGRKQAPAASGLLGLFVMVLVAGTVLLIALARLFR